MHLIFTEAEKEWIDMKPFNWSVKEGCPKDIKEELEKKLKLLYGQEKHK